MLTFLHGWRKKTGCVTLVLACAFVAGWIRSSFTGDYLSLAIGKTKFAILSQQGKISTAMFSSNGQSSSGEPESGWWTVKLPAAKSKPMHHERAIEIPHPQPNWLERVELQFVHYQPAFPYWSIVILLTLLSAWLLLSTPTDPIPQLTAIIEKQSPWRKAPTPRPKRPRRPKRTR